jgi:hypothetical protein
MHIKLGGTVRAAVNMDNDLRDEGMGLIRCCNRGDMLTIHETRNNGKLCVSKVGDEFRFICALHEIEGA